MEDWIDRPASVRRGEEPDLHRLRDYLADALPEVVGTLRVEQFRQGYSNLTYLLRIGERELVLRRPPVGSKVRSAHDMEREYRVLRALSEVYERIPEPVLYCEDTEVLGAPFYLMERVRGVILRARPPAGLELDGETCRSLSEAFVDNLAELHGLDFESAGLGDLGRSEGYVGRQVRGWTERYQASRTDDIPEVESISGWLADQVPGESGTALLHNDYKYDNLVLDPADLTSIRAVLDWEMATVGEPLTDLGTSLGYWVEAADEEALQELRFGPTHLAGSLSRSQLAERYCEQTGRPLQNLTFYYCLGLLKIAVIAQQIYYRHCQGLTRDPRFAGLIRAVRALAQKAVRAADSGQI